MTTSFLVMVPPAGGAGALEVLAFVVGAAGGVVGCSVVGSAVGSGVVGSGVVGSGVVGSGVVGSGVVGSGVVGSGVVGSGAVGSGAVGSGAVGSGAGALELGVDVLEGAGFGVVGVVFAGGLETGADDEDGGALDDEPGSPGTVTVGPLLSISDTDEAAVLLATPPVGSAEVPDPHEARTVTAATAQARTANDFRAPM